MELGIEAFPSAGVHRAAICGSVRGVSRRSRAAMASLAEAGRVQKTEDRRQKTGDRNGPPGATAGRTALTPSAAGATARHRFGWGRSTAYESGVGAALCHRTPYDHKRTAGSWGVACSDGNCLRTMNRDGSQPLQEEDTSALTPALSPRRGRIVASRRVSRWFQWAGGSWAGGVFAGRFTQGGAALCPGLQMCQPHGGKDEL